MNEKAKVNDTTATLYRVAFTYTTDAGLLRNSQYVVPASSITEAAETVKLKLAQRFFGTSTQFRIGTIKLF